MCGEAVDQARRTPCCENAVYETCYDGQLDHVVVTIATGLPGCFLCHASIEGAAGWDAVLARQHVPGGGGPFLHFLRARVLPTGEQEWDASDLTSLFKSVSTIPELDAGAHVMYELYEVENAAEFCALATRSTYPLRVDLPYPASKNRAPLDRRSH